MDFESGLSAAAEVSPNARGFSRTGFLAGARQRAACDYQFTNAVECTHAGA